MPELTIEYANASSGVGNAYESAARFLEIDIETAVRAAQTGQLGQLIEDRQLTRPTSGAEAMRSIEAKKYGPGEKRSSPAARIGELKAMRAFWSIEDHQARRHREPDWRLGELLAKRWSP